MSTNPRLIKINPSDNVAVVANDGGISAGARVDGLLVTQAVPQAHKVALANLGENDPVIRYGVVIGYANKAIPAGGWINEDNLIMPEAPVLDSIPKPNRFDGDFEPLSGFTFEGFRNPNGSVGTRNILAITNTVQCVSGVVDHAVQRIRRELLPKYTNVDDVISLDHSYGCGVAIDAPGAQIPIRTLKNIALNPNLVGSTMVVSLGCEKLQPSLLFPEFEQKAGTISLITLQDENHVGFESQVNSIMQNAEQHLILLNERKRETCPVSDLVVGLQCGGSDAMSGITANPALGYASDLIVRAGGTVLFSEVTEVRDGIDQLVKRSQNREVAEELLDQMAWYDNYLKSGGSDRSANTTPGNKKGGLSNIVEKAMGSIIKSGSMTISQIVPPGERVQRKGLSFAATPASDFICGTLQLAAGMNLHIFTTGRGTPYSLKEVPVIKVASRSDLARRWYDLMDIDAGQIVSKDETVETMGRLIFDKILATASGEKTCAEKLGLSNQLVLFNPGPVT